MQQQYTSNLNNHVEQKNIAIMTSGGDSPGMNMAICSILRYGYAKGLKIKLIHRGLVGLLNQEIEDFDYAKFYAFSDAIFQSGTIIQSSRFADFKLEQYWTKAINILTQCEITTLIIIGGDGSFKAGKKIKDHSNINVIGIPATIDNDIASTDLSIGYSSALNMILHYFMAIRNTAKSFGSFCLLEIMGRECTDLTINTALATFADGVITKSNHWTKQDFVDKINHLKSIHKNWGIFLVTEKMYDTPGYEKYDDIVQYVEHHTNIHMKFDVIGYAQRGASLSAEELILANKMGMFAIDLILSMQRNKIILIKQNQIQAKDYDEAIGTKSCNHQKDIELINALAILNFKSEK